MKWLIYLVAAMGWLVPAASGAQEPARYSIGVLKQEVEPPAWETAFTRRPADDGIGGARLAQQDNATTGQFMKQEFVLTEEIVPAGEDPMPAFQRLIDGGAQYVALDVPADSLLTLADAVRDRDVILFNVSAPDDRLRNEDCRANVFHTAPSRAMLADALAQYLVFKRWREWFLVVGSRESDKLYAEAIKRAAAKFGAEIVEEKEWNFGPDTRRSASAEVPAFTQDVDYDLLIVADEGGEFGDLLIYRTWTPRPTAGTQGLEPQAWHPAIEAWGAVQLQNRFIKIANRRMEALDYQYWVAVRAIGEAATKTQSDDVSAMRDMLRSQEFGIAAFKGVPVNFREWNQQMRQPIPLAHPAQLVSTSPQEGFLHQRSTLDTMGFDQPESACQLN